MPPGEDEIEEALQRAKELERINKISEANRDIIAENNKLLEKQLALLKEMAELKEGDEATERALKAILDEKQAALEKIQGQTLILPDRLQRIAAAEREVNDAQTKLAQNALDADDSRSKNLEEYNVLLTKVRSNLQQNASAGIDTGKLAKGSVKEIEKMIRTMEKTKGTLADADQSGASLQKVFAKMTGMRGGFIGQAIESVQSMSRGYKEFGIQAAAAGGKNQLLMQSIDKLGGLSTIAAAGAFILAAAVVKLAFELDGAAKSLGSSTGMGNQFGGTILQVHKNTALAGATMAEAAGAIGALADNFSAFDPKAKNLNTRLATTLVHLNKLGVDNASAAKSMDYFTRTLSMSADEAAEATTRIATMGRTMGTTSKKMVSDFLAVQDRLSIFGKRGEAVFKDLAAQAKAMNLEITTLTSVATQFDTFDKAAESSAKLNAVLGTNLSTLRLLNMEDNERIHYLRQEINMSVGNFESLDKYTKMYIAQAMGVKSVREAQNLLNMSTAEYNKYLKDQEESLATQEELSDLTRDLVPIMTKLKTALLKVVLALAPFIEIVAVILDFVGTILGSELGQFLLKIAAAIALIYFFVVPIFSGAAATVAGVIAAIKGAGVLAVILALAATLAALYFVIDAVVTNGYAMVVWLGELFGIITKSGSPALWQMPMVMAEYFIALGNAILHPVDSLKKLVGGLGEYFGITHKKGSPELYKIAGVMGQDMEKLASSSDLGFSSIINFAAAFDPSALVSGITSVMSSISALSQATVGTGFIAIKTDGTATSMVAGSDDVIAKMADGKITVDVKMPEMKTPKIELHVQIDGEKLRAIIVEEIYREAGSKL